MFPFSSLLVKWVITIYPLIWDLSLLFTEESKFLNGFKGYSLSLSLSLSNYQISSIIVICYFWQIQYSLDIDTIKGAMLGGHSVVVAKALNIDIQRIPKRRLTLSIGSFVLLRYWGCSWHNDKLITQIESFDRIFVDCVTISQRERRS
jgi:hypothetical protein